MLHPVNSMGRKKDDTRIDIILKKVIKEDFVTASFIQRKLQISYLSAMRILKQLEELGHVEIGEDFTKRRVIKHKCVQ